MTIARVVKSISARPECREVVFHVEVRHTSGAASRWPDEYATYEQALLAANLAGVDVLMGWREEHV